MFVTYRFIDFAVVDQKTYRWLFHELTFAHALLAVTLTCRSSNPETLIQKRHFHIQRAIYLLNEKLSKNSDFAREESTIYIIAILIFVAGELGNYAEIGMHLSGLKQIIGLCGGLDYLRPRPSLHFELDR